jgi:hypothetical protein
MLAGFIGNKLNFVSLRAQDSEIELPDYAFERMKPREMLANIEPLVIDLSFNIIEKISPKAFCSRQLDELKVEELILDYSALESMNKCTLRQLAPKNKQSTTKLNVQFDHKAQNKNITIDTLCACNNQLRMFAQKYNIIIRQCYNYKGQTSGCPIDNNDYSMLDDNCDQLIEFKCDESSAAGFLSGVNISNLGFAGMVVGAVFAFSAAVSAGFFLFNKLRQ